MPRFDVYRGRNSQLLVSVQADHLYTLRRQILVPLLPPDASRSDIKEINPILDVNGRPYVFMAQYIASVPSKAVRGPIANLAHYRDNITRALDILLTGF